MNVMIVGGGQVGSYVASLLLGNGHRITVIEQDETRGEELAEELNGAEVFYGNGTDPLLLDKAGIRKAQVVAAITGRDETNLVVTSLARARFFVPRTIARVNHPQNAWLFTAVMGVDVALNQADLMAHLILEEMSLGDMMTLLKLRQGAYSLIEEKVHPESIAAGKAVRELDLPGECVLTAVLRKGRLIVPRGDTYLEPADEIIALVHQEQLVHLAALLGRAREGASIHT